MPLQSFSSNKFFPPCNPFAASAAVWQCKNYLGKLRLFRFIFKTTTQKASVAKFLLILLCKTAYPISMKRTANPFKFLFALFVFFLLSLQPMAQPNTWLPRGVGGGGRISTTTEFALFLFSKSVISYLPLSIKPLIIPIGCPFK